MIFQSVTGVVGNTALLRLDGITPQHEILEKWEFMDPICIKNRPVKEIIATAEAGGDLKPGDTIIEATSGNSGMPLAPLGCRLGYRVVIAMSEIQSVERRMVMKAVGVELVLTPASVGTKGTKGAKAELI